MDPFFRLRCPGARGDSTATLHRHTNVRSFVLSPRGQYLRAAIGNGLYALAGEVAALALMTIHPLPAVSVAQAGMWLEQRLGSYRLENVPIPNRVDEEDWLSS